MSEPRLALIKADLRSEHALFYRVDDSGQRTNGTETVKGQVRKIHLGKIDGGQYDDKYALVIDLYEEELDMVQRVVINQSSAISGLLASLFDIDLEDRDLWMALNVSDPVYSKKAGRNIQFTNIYSALDGEKTEWGMEMEDMKALKSDVGFFIETVESLDAYAGEIELEIPKPGGGGRSKKSRGSSKRKPKSTRGSRKSQPDRDEEEAEEKPKRGRRSKSKRSKSKGNEDLPNINTETVEFPEDQAGDPPYDEDDLPF